MNADTHRTNAAPSYLLVPMMPTPNGPLHLGHISGPYLKMDVLARVLRQQGCRVSLITTTDTFESHVLQSAEKYGATAEEVCDRFHEEISRDFEYMGIHFDAFVNPVKAPWKDEYRQVHATLVDALIERGQAVEVKESYLFDEETGEDVLGFRLAGECPACSTSTVGFVCENCGLQVTTEMLKAPGGTEARSSLSWRQGDTLALRVEDAEALCASIAVKHLPPEFRQAMTAFIESPENIIRLTVLGGHGVGPYRRDGIDYTLYNTYFGHAVFCGKIFADLHGRGRNAFAADSNVVTVTSCGLDNATDLTSSMAYEATRSGYKAFDHCLGNFFLNLEGAKFSTSRRHAVFVSDMIASPKVDVDTLRLYLASISPQTQVTNFDVQEFLSFHNDWFVGQFVATIRRVWDAVAGRIPGPASDDAVDAFRSALAVRDDALAFERFSLADCVAVVRAFCDAAPAEFSEPTAAFWWLKTMAVLTFPLMPGAGVRIWHALGYAGEPSVDGFAALTSPAVGGCPVQAEVISRGDFRWPASKNA